MRRGTLPERGPSISPEPNETFFARGSVVRAGGALPERGLRSEDKERGISAKRPCLGFLQSSVRGYAERREPPPSVLIEDDPTYEVTYGASSLRFRLSYRLCVENYRP